ncbi:type II secretion system protein [Acetobacterium wieringae]|uniref:type II secretion system protein n=1 Tax=Acetobacterium wieringae TaxID=52694 RepID=UPI0020341C81|nr:prepilin-type N-terminal cleavage/methylation domain-containing protein [Acetobacterium wieringae]URN84606.1 type II secretion system protein [Acetobacterium wieringae]
MELINKIRKSRKGFTLVEIIVVLVILAILAAFTIPAMLGFVNDAKKKAAIAEQREIYVAAQAIATEHFAKEGLKAGGTALGMTITSDLPVESEATNLGSAAVSASGATGVALELKNYLNGDIVANTTGTGATTNNSTWTVKVDANGRVSEVTYTKDGVTLDPLKPSSAVK